MGILHSIIKELFRYNKLYPKDTQKKNKIAFVFLFLSVHLTLFF